MNPFLDDEALKRIEVYARVLSPDANQISIAVSFNRRFPSDYEHRTLDTASIRVLVDGAERWVSGMSADPWSTIQSQMVRAIDDAIKEREDDLVRLRAVLETKP